MGNGFHTVGMVVGISIYLCLLGLARSSMYMRHCLGFTRKRINGSGSIITAQMIGGDSLLRTPFLIVIINRIEFLAAAVEQRSYRTCQQTARRMAFLGEI